MYFITSVSTGDAEQAHPSGLLVRQQVTSFSAEPSVPLCELRQNRTGRKRNTGAAGGRGAKNPPTSHLCPKGSANTDETVKNPLNRTLVNPQRLQTGFCVRINSTFLVRQEGCSESTMTYPFTPKWFGHLGKPVGNDCTPYTWSRPGTQHSSPGYRIEAAGNLGPPMNSYSNMPGAFLTTARKPK